MQPLVDRSSPSATAAPAFVPAPPALAPPPPPFPSGPPVSSVPPPAPPPVPAPVPPPRHRSRLARLVVSAALFAVGILAMADLAGLDVRASAYLALPLTVVGAGLLAATWYGRARSLIAIGAVLTVALGITTAAEQGTSRAGGTVTWRPAAVEQLNPTYRLGIGNARLDLSGLDFINRDEAVQVSVDVGNLTVALPSTVDVTIQAGVNVGNANVFGEQWDGIGQSQRSITDNGPDGPGGGQLRIVAQVDVGDLEVGR